MKYNGYEICIISKDNTLRLQGKCMLVEVVLTTSLGTWGNKSVLWCPGGYLGGKIQKAVM